MANYALTITPQFTPFTYDELVKPVEKYQQVYDAYDASVQKAIEDTAKYANMKESDPEVYKRYLQFKTSADSFSDTLSRQGLGAGTRNTFRDLRSQYSTEIKPLDIAYETKMKDIDMWNKMTAANPNLRAQRNPNETSLMEYVNNPNLGNKWVNLDDVKKDATEAFKNIKSSLTSQEIARLDSTTKMYITKRGLTNEQILQGLAQIAEADPQSDAAQIIQRVQNDVRARHGYDAFDDSIKSDIDSSIASAAWTLSQEEDRKMFEDHAGKLALDYEYWKKKTDYTQTQKTTNPTTNRYTTGLSPASVETKGNLKTTASDLQKTMQALQKTPKKYDKSLKSGISVSDVNVSKLEDLYKELDEKDVEKIKGVLERYKINPQTEGLSAGINAILNPYGLHYSPVAKKGQSVVWGEDDVRSFRQKLAKTYNYYNQKYNDLYKDDSNAIDAIAKYEALENAENTFQVYETTPHAGWLGNETSTKLYQSLKADMNSLTKITDKDGNTVERGALPAEKDVDAVKIDTKGRLKIVSGENEYFVKMPKLKSKLRSIEIIADNMNLQPADNKKVLDLANQSNAYTIDNHLKDDYVENLGNGYTKIITKAGNNLTVHIYKNGQEVASMNQNDVLLNGSQAKLTYLENLSDDIGGEILNTYTTYKPGVNMQLKDYGVNSGQTVEDTNVD